MKRTLIALILFFLFVSVTDAQRRHHRSRRHSSRWKRYRYELIGSGMFTNFMGELGGANQRGSNFLKDFEASMTRFGVSTGMRYKLTEILATKVSLSYGILRGDDKTTKEPARMNRNLNFMSHVVEFATQLEIYTAREKIGHRYNLRRVRGLRGLSVTTYFFVGVGVFWFSPWGKNPQTGEWVALHDLGTEGQGLVPTREPYSQFQIAIPYGIGFKYGLNRKWSVGLELGPRYTFTDYIDDVSTTYFDNDRLRKEKGDLTAIMADPSIEKNGQSAYNQQRGDSHDNDMYMFLSISFSYKLRTTRGGLPKF